MISHDQYSRTSLGAAVAALFILIFWSVASFPNETVRVFAEIGNAGGQVANVLTGHNFRTISDIQAHYDSVDDIFKPAHKVRVLLVPGHEPSYGGAEYGSLKERDMTVELAQDLQGYLTSDPHYDVSVTRDTKDWSPDFAAYFKDKWDDIVAWQKASHAEFSHLMSLGSVPREIPDIVHNNVPSDVALRLYGITKWANDNSIDIAIHIHFNDYPGHGSGPGKHSGFAIYVPASQYGNSTTTKAIADTIFKRLAKYNPVSDLAGESDGIVDEPDLIAIGANNTADAASMLIEYSYIYEPQLTDPTMRSLAIKDLAFQTYLGLEDFFGSGASASVVGTHDTILLPHTWISPISSDSDAAVDIFALQTALVNSGDYPPAGKTLSDCPRSGGFGPCTKAALASFQEKSGITGEDGIVGTKTLQVLNSQY